jgi:dinuclear metal center YbgI/SA1388 family protein
MHDALDTLAPFRNACDWDNVGLLAGGLDWPGKRWLLAIDLTDDVAREAIRNNVDGLIVYHPPIFKGVRSITCDTDGPTAMLAELLANRIAIIATHTAMDVAVGGTNDRLLAPFDLTEIRPLQPIIDAAREYKLVVFAPEAEVAGLRSALASTGAGTIGAYGECSFELRGRGSFVGDETTRPAIGRKQTLEYVDEVRLEMVVPSRRVPDVVRTLYANHSYEEPAFDLYPVHSLRDRGSVGLGRIGRLRKPARGSQLWRLLGGVVDLSVATVVGDCRRKFTHVTAAAGSFGVDAFRDPDAFVITGEFKHHDALALRRRGITAISVGHYESERPILDVIRSHARRLVRGAQVSIARADRSLLARVRPGE